MKPCSTVFAMCNGIIFAGLLCHVSGHLIKENELNENYDKSKEDEQYMISIFELFKKRAKRFLYGIYWNTQNLHTLNVHPTPLNEVVYLKFKKKFDEHFPKIMIENASSTHPTLVNYNNISSNKIARNDSSIHPSVVNYNNTVLKTFARNVSSNYRTILMMTARKKRKNGNIVLKTIVINGSSTHPMAMNNNKVLKIITKNFKTTQSTTLVNNLISKINAREDKTSMLSTHFNNRTLIRMARNANLTHPTLANNSIDVTQYFHQTVASNLSRSERGYLYRFKNHTELNELPYIILIAICTSIITIIIMIGMYKCFMKMYDIRVDKKTIYVAKE